MNPIAAIAIIIKNLDNSLNGRKNSGDTPADVATVVIILAPIKNSIKNGNTCFSGILLPFSISAFLALLKAKNRVIGIIANVLVNFTVTALSSVRLPNWYILSQVDAAAVTEEVSLTAVPANTPNASPDVVEKPRRAPKLGNIKAASTLNKKMTDIA